MTASIFGIIGIVLGALLTYFFNLPFNTKNLYVSTITGYRAEWSKEIKVFIADFIAAIEKHDKNDREQDRFVRQRMELITLNLNPLRDEADEEYLKKMRALYDHPYPGTKEFKADLEKFRDFSMRMVKLEWDEIKAEALSKYGKTTREQRINLRKKWEL